MEDENQSCIVLQFNPIEFKLEGVDITNTYNYWEKLAFIRMNEKQLFPCKSYNNIEFKNYSHYIINLFMIPISDFIKITLNLVIKDLPAVFYPGY